MGMGRIWPRYFFMRMRQKLVMNKLNWTFPNFQDGEAAGEVVGDTAEVGAVNTYIYWFESSRIHSECTNLHRSTLGLWWWLGRPLDCRSKLGWLVVIPRSQIENVQLIANKQCFRMKIWLNQKPMCFYYIRSRTKLSIYKYFSSGWVPELAWAVNGWTCSTGAEHWDKVESRYLNRHF